VTPALRLLLDQNFPTPPYGLRFELLDKTVTLDHFSGAYPNYARVSTPDWKVYLLAKLGKYDALVTSDYHQTNADTEMIALDVTKIGLITWKSGEDDAVVLYGQLLAYMPQIVAQLRRVPATVVRLPKARLSPREHFSRPGDILRERRKRDGLSYQERRSGALAIMRAGLSDAADAPLQALIPPH